MKLGIALPHYGYSIPSEHGLSWKALLDVALWAESAGFASMWVSDHVRLDLSKYGGSENPHPCFEYSTTLGALSVAVKEAELGVLVACAALRPPAVMAKSAQTIAASSRRTFWLGLGAGWYPPDFEAAGVEFGTPSERFSRLARTAELVREFSKPDADVKTIIGGKGGPKVLDLAAAYADGWNISWAAEPSFLSERVSMLNDLWEQHGRGPVEPYVSLGLTSLVAPDEAELRRRFLEMLRDFDLRIDGDPDDLLEAARRERLVCTTAELEDRLLAYRDAGVSEVVCGFGPVPFSFWRRDAADEFVEAVAAIGLATL